MSKALVRREYEFLPAVGAGGLDAFIQVAQTYPMLSNEEEEALARRLQARSDLEAARRLILSHLRFVIHIARGYQGYGLPLADLIQEGSIGLMKAVSRFDPDQGVRLASFAVHWIRAEIYEYILRNWRIVKVATTKAQRKLFFNLHKAKKRLGWFTRDEVETVARELGVECREVVEMEARLSGQDLLIDAHDSGEEDEDGNRRLPAHYFSDMSNEPATRLEAEDWEEKSSRALGRALAGLDERSRHILQRRWLDEPKATLQELADHYGVSAERIRQLENAAIKKLRGALIV